MSFDYQVGCRVGCRQLGVRVAKNARGLGVGNASSQKIFHGENSSEKTIQSLSSNTPQDYFIRNPSLVHIRALVHTT
jgi:hypothetical protein